MSHLLHWIDQYRAYFQHLGWMGMLLYAGLIALVQVAILPVSPLGIGAGFIFGFGRGFLTTMLGTAGGLAFNFLVARYVAREAVSRRLLRNEKFRLIDAAIGKEGWKLVFLLRFCPMPFGLANYAFGLTAIGFWPYFLASLPPIMPTNALFVWMGASTHESLEAISGAGRPRQPFEYVLMGVGLVATLVSLAYIGRVARQAVARAQAEA
jgi:uncharacterized membrane protein YdjX (TVP38/TMEM64 family)